MMNNSHKFGHRLRRDTLKNQQINIDYGFLYFLKIGGRDFPEIFKK